MKGTRRLALAVAVMMLFGVLAACGGGGDVTSTTTTTTTTTTATETTTTATETTTTATTTTSAQEVDQTTTTTAVDDTEEATTTTAPADDTTVGDLGREPYAKPASPSGTIPRNETLYFAGLQWGPVNGYNPLSRDMNNAMAVVEAGGGARIIMFETPYMYNMIDGSFVPLLADGPYQWNADLTELTYKIKPAAYWSDGTKVTAHDAAATWDAGVNYRVDGHAQWTPYIADIVAQDDATVVIKCALVDGKPTNPLQVLTYIEMMYVLQQDWLEKVAARNGGDPAQIAQDPAEDVVWSGPYTNYFDDDTKVVLIRDDGYWGQDASMWGELPAPKYVAHMMYADNNAGQVALAAGEVDVCQQFIANIQDLWLDQGLPISTYMDEAPYGLCVGMPTAWFNLAVPALQNVNIRKAIAYAVDYDAIIANAMTNQSPSFSDVPRSIMNPLDSEQAMYDQAAVADLQFAGNDVDGANKILDDAGILDTDGDGWRELDGENLAFNACCPNGWSDWQAAMEIVAQAGADIGIEITTNFPEWSVYQTVFTQANQTEYDIFMYSTTTANPAQPWDRMRNLMSSEFIGLDGNWSGNYGHYSNPRIDELVQLIPLETDQAKLVEYYTEAVRIYLTDVPSFSLMYRPDQFHCVNETVWTGFTEDGDGNNIPPMHSSDGYAIADLYNIHLVSE